MKRELLFYILSSIEYWEEDHMVGEEVRMLEENIKKLCINRNEPVLEYILMLIEDYLSNKDLGREIKELHIPILIAYGRTNPKRNSSKRINLR